MGIIIVLLVTEIEDKQFVKYLNNKFIIFIKNTMKLEERINLTRLKEVLSCNNLPEKGNRTVKEYESMKAKLYNLSEAVFDEKGYTKIKYFQKNDIGRFCGNGVQTVKTDIKQYICADEEGPYYQDIDIKNCHPILLEHLYKKYNLKVPTFLKEYIENREQTILDYKLKNKLDVIKFINNCKCKYKSKPKQKMIDFHYSLYNYLFKLLKQDYPQIWDSCFSNKKENVQGSFMATVLQHIENDILQIIYNFFNYKNFKVGVLMFDGLMVEKNEEINQKLFDELEIYIKKKSGYELTIVEKNMETNWKPIEGEDCINKFYSVPDIILDKNYKQTYNIETGIQYATNIKKYKKKDKISELMNYLKPFLYRTQKPINYFYRLDTREEFTCESLSKIKEGFNKDVIDIWLNKSSALSYRYKDFSFKELPPDILNSYIAPEDEYKEDLDLSPLDDFVLRIMSGNDIKTKEYIFDVIAGIVQQGKTGQVLVMMGEKGAGKGTFYEFIRTIVGSQYSTVLTDASRVTARFNSILENKICILLDEVVSNAGEFHRFQSGMKGIVTNETIPIEHKNQNVYPVQNHCTYLMATNGFNPIAITEGNRRYCVLEMSEEEIGNYEYWDSFYEWFNINKKYIRNYFLNREYDKHFNQNRPTTKKELELLELNLHIADIFIRDEMPKMFKKNYIDEYDSEYEYDEDEEEYERIIYGDVYSRFINYAQSCGEKKLCMKYFTQYLRKNNYITDKIKKVTYILKN
jgi:hypothetical protein